MTTLREKMTRDLQLCGLSERTQEAYLRAVRQLADYCGTPPDRLTEEQLRNYFLYLKNEKRFAPASLKMAYYGIRYFYTHTAPRQWVTLERLRVPQEKRLPDVLTVDEVRRLIAAVRTLHNQTYLWTVYSLGLRLQEGLNLHIGDVDGQRMLVHVHRGKGAKDPLNSEGSASATSLFEACSAFTHVSACLFARSPKVTFTRVLQRMSLPPCAALVASGRATDWPGGIRTHWRSPTFTAY